MEKEFSRVRSAKDIVISLILIAAGAVLVALPTGTSVNIVGFFMIFTGLVLLLVLRTSYRLDGTKEFYRKKEFFFPQSKKDSFTAALQKDPSAVDLSEENTMSSFSYLLIGISEEDTSRVVSSSYTRRTSTGIINRRCTGVLPVKGYY